METPEKRYWDLPAVLLLVAALWMSVLRLWITDWTQHLERVEMVVFLAIILGLMLGKSSFSPRAVRWLGFLYSIILVPWQMGLIIDDKILWGDRIRILVERLSTTTWTFLNNQPVQDPILFIVSMVLLYWILSLMATYQLVRYRRPWVPVGVSTVAVLVIEYYHPFLTRSSLLTAAYLFFVLMLIGRVYYLARRQDWEDNHVAVDAETSFDLSRGTLITGLVLVVLAWNFPTLIKVITPGSEEQEWVTISWQGLKNRLSNMVASLESPASLSATDFGNQISLGTGAELSDDVAMIITPRGDFEKEIRYYWRGRSYNYYAGGGWQNTFSSVLDVAAGQKPFKYPAYSPRSLMKVTVKNVSAPARTLYSPGPPVSISRSGKAQFLPLVDEEMEVVSTVASPALFVGEAYEVEAYLSVPTIRQLSETAEIYPDWVKQNYLQLPENYSPRVRELAEQITAGMDNPYDKVEAVTNYLRDNIQYTTTVPNAPDGQDPIEWFLFTHKQGFCNYYATAEVLMLRSIGIPARVVVGYAQGQEMENGIYYMVRQKDSHAWPEVYFYGAGWVPFEPTVSQPELSLPPGADPAAAAEDQPRENGPANRSVTRDRDLLEEGVPEEYTMPEQVKPFPYQWVILASLVVLIAAGLAARGYLVNAGRWVPVPVLIDKTMRRRGVQPPGWLSGWSRFIQLSTLERIYAGIPWMVRFLGGKPSQSQTPAEQVGLLTTLLPEGSELAGVVLEEYQRSMYSPHPGDDLQAQAAYRQLWRMALRSWLRRHFGIEIQVT